MRLTDERGLFEHALHGDPRPEHGYCVDDVARGLVVICREPDPRPVLRSAGPPLPGLPAGRRCAGRDLPQPDGHRRDAGPTRPASATGGDARCGGSASPRRHAPDHASCGRAALLGFPYAPPRRRSPHLRAMAFAALGAGELLLGRPAEQARPALLHDAVDGDRRRTRPDPELALAGAPAALRQRLGRRGAAGRRQRAAGPGCRGARPASCWSSCCAPRPATATCRSPRSAVAAGSTRSRRSTSSRSRSPRSPTPAPARIAMTADDRAGGRGRAGLGVVPRRQRQRDADVRPGHRRRLRRPAAGRPQPQPGRRVDPGDAVHRPARPRRCSRTAGEQSRAGASRRRASCAPTRRG